MLVKLNKGKKKIVIKSLLFELLGGNMDINYLPKHENIKKLEFPIEEVFLITNELWKIIRTTLGNGYLEDDNNINYSQEEVIIIDDAVHNYQYEIVSFYREEVTPIKSYYIGGIPCDASGSLRLWSIAVFLANTFNDREMLDNIQNRDYWFSWDEKRYTENNRVHSLLSYLIQYLPRADDDEYDSYKEESRQGFIDFYEGDPDNLWNTD